MRHEKALVAQSLEELSALQDRYPTRAVRYAPHVMAGGRPALPMRPARTAAQRQVADLRRRLAEHDRPSKAAVQREVQNVRRRLRLRGA